MKGYGFSLPNIIFWLHPNLEIYTAQRQRIYCEKNHSSGIEIEIKMKISLLKKHVIKFVMTAWSHYFRFISPLQDLFVEHQQLLGILVINNINFMRIIRTSYLLRQSNFRLTTVDVVRVFDNDYGMKVKFFSGIQLQTSLSIGIDT